MSERFRPARADEVAAVARLSAHSFPGVGRPPAAWEDSLSAGPFGGTETLWVAEEEGRPVASCRLLPLRQWIAGAPLPVMGLGTVAVAPTHRRRGLAGRLVEAGMRRARERGDVASALYPFRASFYERLGYGLAGEAHQYRLPPRALPDDPAARARVRLVESAADQARMRAVYAAVARGQTGQLERTERSWRAVWDGSDGGAAVLVLGEDGAPEGYAIVRYPPAVFPERRPLEVEEQGWTTPAGRRGVHAWLASLGDQWGELLYRAHPDEGFAERVEEPRLPPGAVGGWGLWFPSAVLLRGPMFRLLDVRAALEQRRVHDGHAATLRLEVDDPQLPENRGPWRVRLEEGRLRVERDDGGDVDVTVQAGIGTLSRIYVGALEWGHALASDRLHADRPEAIPALDAAFRVPRPWTFDRF